MTNDIYSDLAKAVVLALMVLLMCYILRGTDWKREQSIFTEINEHMSQTAD